MKSVGFTEGMVIGMAYRGGRSVRKVFDWGKAVELIKEHGIRNARAGLDGDWECTNCRILVNGDVVREDEDACPYMASPWAVPKLLDCDTGVEYECWTDEKGSEYGEETIWPDSAVEAFQK
jgi:hypothetical protein